MYGAILLGKCFHQAYEQVHELWRTGS